MKYLLISIISLLFLIEGYAQNSKELTFKVEGLSCWNCANSSTSILKGVEGVDSAYVNFDTKEGVAYTNGTVSRQDIKNALSAKNFEALFENETLIPPLSDEELKGLDINTIIGGKKIKFNEYLTKGKVTVFDFYADWCGPCRVFSPKLEHLVKDNPNVSLRKVDIVDWKSALANQLTKDYQLPALPFTLIFDDKGNLLAKIEGNNVEKVEEIIRKNK